MRSSILARMMIASSVLLLPVAATAQGTLADYERATGLRAKYEGLALNVPGPATWIEKTTRFWYRKSVKGGNEFVMVDADTRQRRPAFDHEKLAASLSKETGNKYTAVTLPFSTFTFADGEKAIEVTFEGTRWTCSLSDYACKKGEAIGGPRPPFSCSPSPDDKPVVSPDKKGEALVSNYNVAIREAGKKALTLLSTDGSEGDCYQLSSITWSPDSTKLAVYRVKPGYRRMVHYVESSPEDQLQPKHSSRFYAKPGDVLDVEQPVLFHIDAGVGGAEAPPLPSGGNAGVGGAQAPPLPSGGNAVVGGANRLRQGFGGPPELRAKAEAPPLPFGGNAGVGGSQAPPLPSGGNGAVGGSTKTQLNVDNTLFPNAYDLSRLEWRKDSRALTFEYNQRGHQAYRVIEVDAATGKARAVISEEPKTFFNYRQANHSQTDSGKKYRYDVQDGKEIIWMSERDGWNHLYLYDGVNGTVKNQITKGDWAVRGVVKVDEETRQIWFSACGMYPGKDPYFLHYHRINFDGSGLTALTEADANHNVAFSTDMKHYVDTYSRVDMAPVSELRRTSDDALVMELERGDIAELVKAGWKPPEVFTALGRDGNTEIWGVIYRPTTFDPSKKYPVIESIYAGPQGSFVPKSFSAYAQMQAQAELGFIVVQIDGMGTSNRSKAFHDVAWMNLGDAGFPDRILWHKALAAKYPYYDTTRVGIYGNSAGGQNSLGGLLFHPEFYKAAVSSVGCHDNRMDKIWWNEQWMGWPIGPHYEASSNVVNAHRLQGKVLLVVGELDTNVDPSSTMHVVNALIKANKTFDLLVIPGAGHGPGGAYGERKRFDFFVQHLLGVTPPAWNEIAVTTQPTGGGDEAMVR